MILRNFVYNFESAYQWIMLILLNQLDKKISVFQKENKRFEAWFYYFPQNLFLSFLTLRKYK